ncbi:DUF7594 domain-containing protein [Sphaerisporangium dianthi]|uniref:DNRLRE domain-containing protein n=1 Tax=Sphaerisporangium dianthi TaxID=1436120 RepID=A0ABV9CLM1_9ACTN
MRTGSIRLFARVLVAALLSVPLTMTPAHASIASSTISLRPKAWTYVSSADPRRSHWNEDVDAPVGLAGTFDQADEPQTVYRSFFAHDVSALRGKKILGASVTMLRPDASCENRIRGFELWQTGPISKSTKWERQPEWNRTLAAVPAQWECDPTSPYVLDVTAAVSDVVAGGSGRFVLGVRAGFEDRPQGRLAFGNDPELRITYEYDKEDPYPSNAPIERVSPDGWTYVDSGRRNVSHWKEEAPVPAGFLGRHRVARAFFRFPLPSLPEVPARAKLMMPRADVCEVGEKPLQLWETDSIDEGTTWRRQPRWSRLVGTYTWGSCDASGGMLVFDVSEAVAQAQAAGRTAVTFGLRSQDERDRGRYLVKPGPTLGIGSPPGGPIELMTDVSTVQPPDMIEGIGPFPCGRGAERSYVPFVPEPTAVFDPGAAPAMARWQWETLDGEPVHEKSALVWYDGRAFGDQVGADGGAYRWRVRGEYSSGQVGEWSPWCEYVVDTTKPDRPAKVEGTPYGGPTPKGGPGVPGRFTLSPNGVADVGGYFYRLDGEPWARAVAGPDGVATVTYTPTAAGFRELAVISLDRASNRAVNATFYYFVVAPAA